MPRRLHRRQPTLRRAHKLRPRWRPALPARLDCQPPDENAGERRPVLPQRNATRWHRVFPHRHGPFRELPFRRSDGQGRGGRRS